MHKPKQKHLQTIFKYSSFFSILLNTKGEILEMNQNAKDFLNSTIGLPISDSTMLNTNTKDSFINAIQTVSQTGKPLGIESSLLNKNRIFNIIFSPIQNDTGEVIQILAEGQDITQQKHYEQQLITEQIFKDAILNNVADGIFVFDVSGNLIFSNDVADEIFRLNYYYYLDSSNLNPIDVFDFYTVDGSRLLRTDELVFTKSVKGVEVSNFEQLVKLKEELPDDLSTLKQVFTPKSLSVSSRIIRNDTQEMIGIVISYKDITEQKIYEQQLIQEQAFTNAILNNTAEGISVFDANGKKTYINEIARELTGLSNLPEITSLQLGNPYDFYTIDGKRKYSFEELPLGLAIKGVEVKNFEEIIQLKDILPNELAELRKSFKPRYLSVNSRIIKNDLGAVKSIVISYRDITEQKNTEMSLIKVNQRLDSIREVERRRLARELHDGIVQDLIGFSYEVAGFENQLSSQDDFNIDAKDLKDMRDKLTSSIKQLRVFISDLRPVGLEEFGLQSALESYVALLERDQQTSHTFPNITIEIADVGELTAAITLCLFRSAQESLINAIKHARADNILVTLILKQSITDTHLVMTIKDDGIGFNVPKNISDFASEQHFGLIGLSERVALIEGSLLIESQVAKKGTTMTITVPYESY